VSTTSVRSDAFEASAAAKIAETHPDADLLALLASFNLVRLSTLHMHRLESEVHRDAGWSMAGFRVMFCVWVAHDLELREIARFSGLLGPPSPACSTPSNATAWSNGTGSPPIAVW
jgi:hypothetical protein